MPKTPTPTAYSAGVAACDGSMTRIEAANAFIASGPGGQRPAEEIRAFVQGYDDAREPELGIDDDNEWPMPRND